MKHWKRWQWCLYTTLVVLLQPQESSEVTHTVECRDQQEICECERDANVCEFTLEMKQLQTFTSYVKSSTGKLVTPKKVASSYYLNESGYIPSLPPPFNSSFPEYGECWREMFTSEWSFTEAGCSLPMMVDGLTYRWFVAVNGRIPGPTLIVTEGQTLVVNVVNSLTSEGVTIHWHGIAQQDTPWMDGVVLISQPPITPGATFRYIFKADPSGTHWYHAHSGAQRADGLFGALVVREKTETLERVYEMIGLGPFIDEPDRHTLSLLDWQQDPSPDLYAKIHSVGFYSNMTAHRVPQQTNSLYHRTKSIDGSEVGAVPYWSGLINGRGRYDSDTFSVLSVFNISFGTVYRFRVIGAQSLYAYRLEVEGHRLVVVATDGYLIKPTEVDYIILHSGETFDFLLNATQPVGNYWIHAQTLELSNDEVDTTGHTAEGVLHYADDRVSVPDPFTKYSNVRHTPRQCIYTGEHPCIAINCPFKEFPSETNISCIHLHELQSLFPNPDHELPNTETSKDCKDCIQFFNFYHSTRSQPVNGRNFKLPTTPYQTYPGQYERDVADPNTNTCDNCRVENEEVVDCSCTNVVKVVNAHTLEQGQTETVMFVLSALEPFAHPVHFHGHRFFIIHVGHGTYNNGILEQYSQDLECDIPFCLNPTWRNGIPKNLSAYASNGKLRNTAICKDTVIVPAGGYVVVAFLPSNPGYWFLHCHIEVHLLAGMGVIIQEYPEREHNSPPPDINRVGNFLWSVEEFNEKTSTRNSSANGEDKDIQCNRSLRWVAGFWVCIALLVALFVTNIVSCIGCYYRGVLRKMFQREKSKQESSKVKEIVQYSKLDSETEPESNC